MKEGLLAAKTYWAAGEGLCSAAFRSVRQKGHNTAGWQLMVVLGLHPLLAPWGLPLKCHLSEVLIRAVTITVVRVCVVHKGATWQLPAKRNRSTTDPGQGPGLADAGTPE